MHVCLSRQSQQMKVLEKDPKSSDQYNPTEQYICHNQ